MKKLLLPAAICLAVISLTGCGEDNEGIFGSGSSNELTLSSFEKVSQGQIEAVARIEQTYSRGENKVVVTNIVNNFDGKGPNTSDQTVLAANFEGNLNNADIRVDGRIVKRPIYERNSNKYIDYQTTYEAYDLGGYQTRDYIAGNTVNDSRGVFTDLNNYDNISATATFPPNSICYIPVVSSEKSFFIFDNRIESRYKTLDAWINATEQRFSDNRELSVSREPVGNNNIYEAAKVKFFAVRSEPDYLYSAVDYKKKVYEADFFDRNAPSPNTNKRTGVVDCTLVNDVAAKFLTDQIRNSYRIK